MTDYTYFVSGKVYIRPHGSAQQFEWPGLIDTVTLSIAENNIRLPDRTQPGGGTYKEVKRIDTVSITLNHRELSPSTLARALFGSESLVASAAIADEQHAAYKGQFIRLAHPGPYTGLSVTDTVPAAIDPENYEARPAGLYIPSDAPGITDAQDILVTYTHPAYHRIQGLTGTPPDQEIFFEGLNEASNDDTVSMTLHKVAFGAAEEFALLSADDFANLSLTGEVQKDTSKPAGESQYFVQDIVAAT